MHVFWSVKIKLDRKIKRETACSPLPRPHSHQEGDTLSPNTTPWSTNSISQKADSDYQYVTTTEMQLQKTWSYLGNSNPLDERQSKASQSTETSSNWSHQAESRNQSNPVEQKCNCNTHSAVVFNIPLDTPQLISFHELIFQANHMTGAKHWSS